jgi:hypothetical protein
VHIRVVHEHEPALPQDIERAAGACFRDIGMPEIADDLLLEVGVPLTNVSPAANERE